ncbi:MAG: protein-methionine-sulfoxide reductase catalytic subunit MsrP [Burkholderiaceae bacterium]|nr:protein-methionine-sulfoxide reductase catalytic subunit MsrP [Burkholderiaceae bacterium]
MARSDLKGLIRGTHLASQVTPEQVFRSRRSLLLAASFAASGLSSGVIASSPRAQSRYAPLPGKTSRFSILDQPVPFAEATTYNNFFEFGLDKDDPADRAPGLLKTSPWKVSVEGLVAKPREFDIDELRKLAPMEERVSRLRCVEGWSMVIPWVGYSLSELIKRVQPLGSAKFIEFTTLADPQQMPGLAIRQIKWPYIEALRIDEALNPLAMLTFGMYGVTLPEQNGAPVRLILPWKYGFKSIKSIVKIRLVEAQPPTLWTLTAPREYGFYANVNPEVPHPRWSQATERVLGTDFLFAPRRKTEMFNGYAELVAGLYAGMDLKTFY